MFSYSGIRSVAFDEELLLYTYPNPAADQITFTVPDMNLVKQVQINDIRGNRVYNRQNASSAKLPGYIDVSFLPAGVYILRVVSEEGNLGTFRILKQ